MSSSRSPPASRTWPSSSRSRTASAERKPRSSPRASAAAATSTRLFADLLDAEADVILSGLDTVGAWDAVIDAEPSFAVVLTGERFDAALLAIANFVDLKSPYFLGHGQAVSELAAEAGEGLGLPEAEVQLLRRAGLVHGLGRLGVLNAILDSADRLAPPSGSASAFSPMSPTACCASQSRLRP